MTPPAPDSPDSSFAERLVASQTVDASLRDRHEKELKNMFEQTLTTPRKAAFTLSVILCSVMTVALTIAALSSHSAHVGLRIGLGLGAVYAAGWLIMGIRVLRRGSINLRTDHKLMSAWPWVFMVMLITLLLVMTGQHADSVRSVWMLLYGLTFLLMASMFLIQYWISDARLKVEERLLEMQLRIAELVEELRKKG